MDIIRTQVRSKSRWQTQRLVHTVTLNLDTGLHSCTCEWAQRRKASDKYCHHIAGKDGNGGELARVNRARKAALKDRLSPEASLEVYRDLRDHGMLDWNEDDVEAERFAAVAEGAA